MRKSITLLALVTSFALPTAASAGTLPVHGHFGNILINGVVEEYEGEREPTSPQEAGPLHATLPMFFGLVQEPIDYEIHFLLTISQHSACPSCASHPSLSLARVAVRRWWTTPGEPSPNPFHVSWGAATLPISCTATNKPVPTPDQGPAGGTTLEEGMHAGTAGEGWDPVAVEFCGINGEWIQGLSSSVDHGIFYPDWQQNRSFSWEVTEG